MICNKDMCSTIPKLGNVHVKGAAQCRRSEKSPWIICILLQGMINAISFSPTAVIGFSPYAPLPLRTWSRRTKMFLLLAQGFIERIVLQVYIIILLLFYSTFIPGGECQEENKEKEIHQLWDGESEFWDKSNPPDAFTPLPSFAFAFIGKFLLSGLHKAVRLC